MPAHRHGRLPHRGLLLLYGFDIHELFRRPRLHALTAAGSLDREPAFDRHRARSKRQQLLNEFAHGYGMRRCRYRGQGKAHIQHVLTAIAVNIERLSGLSPTGEAPTPRRPTAFQNYLDQRDIPRPKSWRTLGS
ncbi:transposase [Streptomyces sp. NPDC059340]|uniref:transposase n=1 Tax=Streptomyces sp. NPDC059340 TaxID=3346806 RepID=UPI00368E1F19